MVNLSLGHGTRHVNNQRDPYSTFIYIPFSTPELSGTVEPPFPAFSGTRPLPPPRPLTPPLPKFPRTVVFPVYNPVISTLLAGAQTGDPE